MISVKTQFSAFWGSSLENLILIPANSKVADQPVQPRIQAVGSSPVFFFFFFLLSGRYDNLTCNRKAFVVAEQGNLSFTLSQVARDGIHN